MSDSKKKILYVITKSNFGGAQRYVFELASHFKMEGREVAVAFGGNGVLKEKLAAGRIPTFDIPSFQRDVSVFKEIHALTELYRTIRTFKPDILHLNSSKAGLIGTLAGRLARVPQIIFTAHGWPYLEDRPWHWKLMARTGSWLTTLLAHRVIVVSWHDYKQSDMPLMREKCTMIHTGVGHIPFLTRGDAQTLLEQEYGVPIGKQSILVATTAELVRNKNLSAAINALAVLKKTTNTKITYVIFGDGEDRPILTQQIEKLELHDSVHLLGHVPDARLLLKAFDIFLLPSLKEGLPYALLEAGAAELPCIVSHVGGIPEVIESGVSGILIDPKDPTTITDALAYLAQSEKARAEFGLALKSKTESDFTLNNLFKKTGATYSTNSRAT